MQFSREFVQFIAPQWASRQFARAISLGNFCQVANSLRELNLRAFSGPFDWIFTIPEVTADILNDNFRRFLDASFYDPVPIEGRHVPEANRCHHRYYLEKFGLQFLFNHHSPDQEGDFAYFLRAVDRFREAAKTNETLFIQITQNPLDLEKIPALSSALSQHTERPDLLNILIKYNPSITSDCFEQRWQAVSCSDTTLSVIFYSRSPTNGVTFTSQEDNHLFHEFLRALPISTIQPALKTRTGPQSQGEFDEAWYLQTYPDVAQAVESGFIRSGWHHYVMYGRHEGRGSRHNSVWLESQARLSEK